MRKMLQDYIISLVKLYKSHPLVVPMVTYPVIIGVHASYTYHCPHKTGIHCEAPTGRYKSWILKFFCFFPCHFFASTVGHIVVARLVFLQLVFVYVKYQKRTKGGLKGLMLTCMYQQQKVVKVSSSYIYSINKSNEPHLGDWRLFFKTVPLKFSETDLVLT